ncbi:Os05g0141100 [Oryza sativa Japonica Group]|uniref:Os05g0141100 protein n=1 Tax=Oryza sativa subsp. japonica TaxID=39947 RepID=Q5KQL6_ORYSJ|nr:unknown protein [Oryza sativa Japonica Group]BAF16516.1 Os05g0141100 [Oryza sativa Japonica Group]|eukprot:NP_001054602.1 Os05g0141100 [Oryza sativa Japonica Group]
MEQARVPPSHGKAPRRRRRRRRRRKRGGRRPTSVATGRMEPALARVIWQTNCETEQQSTACHCDHCVHGFYHHHRALNEQASYCRLFYATAHTHQLATTSRGF